MKQPSLIFTGSVDANHDRCCLDNSGRFGADLETEILNRGAGDGCGNNITACNLELDNAVYSTVIDSNDLARELVAGGESGLTI